MPDASAVASPPLEPPAVTSGSHGLRVQPAQRRVGVDAQAEIRQVRPADRDRARGAHALHHRRVDRRDGLGQRREARVVGVPATSMFSLTVNGTPCSGPRGPSHRAIGRVRRRPRLLGQHERDRVEVAVDRLDALEVRLDDLARGTSRAAISRPALRRRDATAPRTSTLAPPTRECLPTPRASPPVWPRP